jgi:hypothetical protein
VLARDVATGRSLNGPVCLVELRMDAPPMGGVEPHESDQTGDTPPVERERPDRDKYRCNNPIPVYSHFVPSTYSLAVYR